MNKSMRKFIDIGANLTDAMYQGVYHGSKKHQPDLTRVLERAWGSGVQSMIITGGNLDDTRLFSTVGCHPTRCNDFTEDSSQYLNNLSELIRNNRNKVVAIGECGLDYDRTNFCEKDIQLKYFEHQLQLCNEHKLPLFLHCRAAADDLVVILNRNRDSLHGGVVHSFDGNQDALNKILDLGFSLRTEENLEVASKIPTERLLIETDCPWCEVKPTHPGYKHVLTKFPSVKKEKFTPGSQVKGRNEPVNIVQVLEVLAAIRNEDIDQLSEAIYENTNKLFFCNMSL
ncbi:unnamed protein product [Leptidea sinapis]|uniref:Deoxyribonuclease TATDN1 n=1 Tax=Leptidea sinapis TaxID=189913 RepID=A0A5E4R3A8_9NEOP|nr:unnamed protein product [Leptidea sinapis]